MDMLVVNSAPTVTTQQATTQGQSASKVNGTSETVPFQKQLNDHVNQSEAKPAPTATQSTETAAQTAVVEQVETTETVLSAEQLLGLIEDLLVKVEELIDVPLTDEDAAALEELSMQLFAILQLFAADNESITDVLGHYTQANDVVNSLTTNLQMNNNLLFKLQDQLLLLQQTLKEGNVKVVQGQEPEQFLTQAMVKLNELLDTTKKNSRTILENQLTAPQNQSNSLTIEQAKNSSFEQLKQLAKQVEYVQIANQVQSQPVSQGQAVEVTTVNQVQAAIPFSAQLQEVVTTIKGQTQSFSSFTPVNQFADTVKSLVVQKFDLAQLTNGISQARIMLTPENLGSVDIRLSMQNGVLTAVFAAETAMGRDALENQMALLRGALAAQGITVDRLEVTQTTFSDELNWQEQRQQQMQQEQDDLNENDESFEEQLQANAQNQELGYGRSVNEMI